MDDTFDAEKVKRFEPQGQYEYEGMGEDPDGEWVASSDYDKLLEMYRKLVPAVLCSALVVLWMLDVISL